MQQRIVFKGAVPAARLWVIVRQFANANGLRMWTDNDQQNALLVYCSEASKLN